ncbi:1602_t:CDS:2 [Cetraspora pellucida]|uniref:1602_t:CDS:1 n=1 Tax=Cetraspora pellucida TaxID=1433469 RepID=A0ACA9MJX2_9GLOM|nr:1602_t:CDS:2 [Cetraspora pellucida]
MLPSPLPKKTHSQLNNAQCKQICKYSIKNLSPKYPSVEKVMNIWVGQVSVASLDLTDELVKLKGHEFKRLLGISENELKFSNR